MHKSFAKGAVLATLATSALLVPAVPAVATTATTTTATTAAAAPYSSFAVRVKATKRVWAGDSIKYSISATNKGPHYADAWFVGGVFPKGVDTRKIRFSSSIPKTECTLLTANSFFCFADQVIEVGDSFSVTFYAKTKKNARGSQKATLGVFSYNVDQGMENMSKAELDRLGIPGYVFSKTVRTTVVR
ncbi:hypothetical protein [Nonomuraea sp. NPDC050783]|uniref:hypothetical protein n=1 Tax=Nonomuraea sp. NPDC050783 TaxID=3154634 RepID=UPI0034658898